MMLNEAEKWALDVEIAKMRALCGSQADLVEQVVKNFTAMQAVKRAGATADVVLASPPSEVLETVLMRYRQWSGGRTSDTLEGVRAFMKTEWDRLKKWEMSNEAKRLDAARDYIMAKTAKAA